jgi:hypothetical protein
VPPSPAAAPPSQQTSTLSTAPQRCIAPGPGGLCGLPRIFVSIAAYRDPECQWTVRDLFRQATHPQRVHVGIVWQVCVADMAGGARCGRG